MKFENQKRAYWMTMARDYDTKNNANKYTSNKMNHVFYNVANFDRDCLIRIRCQATTDSRCKEHFLAMLLI